MGRASRRISTDKASASRLAFVEILRVIAGVAGRTNSRTPLSSRQTLRNTWLQLSKRAACSGCSTRQTTGIVQRLSTSGQHCFVRNES